MRPARPILASCVVALATAAPASASAAAKTVPWDFQMVFSAPARTQEYTDDLPFLVKGKQRIKVGRRTYVGAVNNITATAFSTDAALSFTRQEGFGLHALFAERPLTAAEQRTFVEAVPLFTDADVLVVAQGHPACGGLSTAQAQAIATGSITNWQQLFPAAADTPIAVRYRVDGSERVQPRFGVVYQRVKGQLQNGWAPGASGDPQGGVGAAARGDQSVAAITAYSHLTPDARAATCLVPLDGVAPTDETVSARAYPAAYRVTYVTTKEKPTQAADKAWRSKMLALMRSQTVRDYLRGRGLLTVG